MEGILCIDKPAGITSFDVVARLRGITHTKKIGHAGTLDPMATGVLPVFLGRAAKAVDLLPNHNKTYVAILALGVTTSTQDMTGEILTRRDAWIPREPFETAVLDFIGEQEQLPPMYSAVRVGGRRLYDLARRGVAVDRKLRKITVHSIETISCDEAAHTYTIRVRCSRGTYIRTLCHDIGARLGCGAALASLRREEACGFTLEDCVTLEQAREFCGDGRIGLCIRPVSSAFSHLPRLSLAARQSVHFRNGLCMGLSQFGPLPDSAELAVFEGETFLGLASPDYAADRLIIRKLFALGENQ